MCVEGGGGVILYINLGSDEYMYCCTHLNNPLFILELTRYSAGVQGNWQPLQYWCTQEWWELMLVCGNGCHVAPCRTCSFFFLCLSLCYTVLSNFDVCSALCYHLCLQSAFLVGRSQCIPKCSLVLQGYSLSPFFEK